MVIVNPSISNFKSKYNLKNIKSIICSSLILGIFGVSLYHLYHKEETFSYKQIFQKTIDRKYNIALNNDTKLLFIKGEPRLDKYGIDLNINILDGIYSIGFNNDPFISVEDWELYTPSCPYLHPIKYPESIINPKCEGNSLQFSNYDIKKGRDLPYSLRLDTITNQMKKWNDWKKNNGTNPYYRERKVKELLGSDYHPFNYDYSGKDSENVGDIEYYSKVIKSRMDEVPDPRRRRLFSFIMFNAEYDLLDLYLSEYYDIIDYFVIYESNTTFSGYPKPLYFTRTLLETNRYDKFKDKLIPLPCKIIVDEDNGRGKAFPREHLARRTLIEKGLRSVHARHGDLFIHGDLDEMPKIHILSRMKKCGGWEHLQAGIGGGPKSFKDPETKSYFIDKNIKVKVKRNGIYIVDYERHLSLGFLSWFYEYSFNVVQDKKKGTVAHPNIAIFDARRSLGQLVDYINHTPGFKFEDKNKNKKQEKKSTNKKQKPQIKKIDHNQHYDPLEDPNFDPYQGYSYTDNTNDRKIGKGYIGEYTRFATSMIKKAVKEQKSIIWNGGYHLSSFLATIEQFYYKISSYSHFKSFGNKSKKEIEKDIISRIKGHYYIYGRKKKYNRNTIFFPTSYTHGYEYNFDYNYWIENTKNLNCIKKSFEKYVDNIKHEIPTQVWRNPICYSFMIDRDFGLEKKLWWQIIPKGEWKTVHFENLDKEILKSLMPKGIPKSLKEQMLEEFGKNYSKKNF